MLRRRRPVLRGWEVRGRAVRDDGAPVARARVSLINEEGHRVAWRIADRSGSFRLRAPGGGPYLLVAGSAGYFPEALPVVADKPLTTTDVLLVASSSVQGVVREEGVYSPVPGAVVVVIDADGAVVRSTRTNDEGDYAFAGMATGTYVLAAGNRHHRCVSQAVRVASHSTSVVDISVRQRLVTVAGSVRHRDGTPAVGAHITLSDDSGLSLVTRTEADGHYRFTNVPTGEFTLAAGPAGRRARHRLVLDGDRLGADLAIDAPAPPGPWPLGR